MEIKEGLNVQTEGDYVCVLIEERCDFANAYLDRTELTALRDHLTKLLEEKQI